jgi:hypothetical protein
VVKLAQDVLGAPAQAVVKRGEAVEQHQRHAVDRDAHHLPRTPVQRCQHDEHGGAGERQNGPDEMSQSVELLPRSTLVGSVPVDRSAPPGRGAASVVDGSIIAQGSRSRGCPGPYSTRVCARWSDDQVHDCLYDRRYRGVGDQVSDQRYWTRPERDQSRRDTVGIVARHAQKRQRDEEG